MQVNFFFRHCLPPPHTHTHNSCYKSLSTYLLPHNTEPTRVTASVPAVSPSTTQSITNGVLAGLITAKPSVSTTTTTVDGTAKPWDDLTAHSQLTN